jgi:hypothetical protein
MVTMKSNDACIYFGSVIGSAVNLSHVEAVRKGCAR